MPLLRTVAEDLSNNQLISGVIEEIIDRDAMLELLPFTQVNSKAMVYVRESSLATGDYLDPNETVNESASAVTDHVAKLKILIGDVDVDKFLDETMSDANSQKALQIAMKAKGMMRQFKQKLITGNETSAPKEFNGLNRICTLEGRESAIGANGGAITLSALDALLDEVKNGADALIMRQGTLRALKALWRDFGGNTGGMMQINNFGLSVPAHEGVPIIVNDWIPGDVTQGSSVGNTCSIYAVKFNEADGLHGIYGGPNAGFRIEDIGTVQNKDATRTRIKWYHGLVLRSTQSVFALRGITNI